VVWLPKSGALFSSDLVYVDRLLLVLPISNTRDWTASLAEIEKLDPKVIIPGHGRICDLGKARRETRDYLVLLRAHARKAVDDLVDIQSAVDTLDQSAFRQLENYEALKGINANRVYLEVEKE
jgi:glyoxylase-like metal-dependent hydrolase (beta-lactamase superfamily II)